MARWYDSNESLARHLETLRDMQQGLRDSLIKGMFRIIRMRRPDVLCSFVSEFSLDLHRRRWYDRDPYLWLLINGLRYADKEFLTEIVRFLDDKTYGETWG